MTRELDKVLIENFWHLAAHRTELDKSGDYIRLDWMAGELVLFNDEGDIIAFNNLCPHRGTRLFRGDFGTGRAVCPYHAWSYRGGVLHIPASKTFLPEEIAGARLRKFEVAWCGDFLFVGIDPRTDLPTQLDATFEPLADVSRQISGRRDFNAFEFQAPWRIAVENALETYHVNLIHHESLGTLGLKEERVEYHGANMIYWGHVTDRRADRALRAMERYFDIDVQYKGYWTAYMFPFTMISATFGYSYSLQNFFPSISSGRSHFSSRLLSAHIRKGAEAAVDSFLDSTARMNRNIFEEDHAICERVSPLFDLSAAGRIFGPQEARVRQLHQLLTEEIRLLC